MKIAMNNLLYAKVYTDEEWNKMNSIGTSVHSEIIELAAAVQRFSLSYQPGCYFHSIRVELWVHVLYELQRAIIYWLIQVHWKAIKWVHIVYIIVIDKFHCVHVSVLRLRGFSLS